MNLSTLFDAHSVVSSLGLIGVLGIIFMETGLLIGLVFPGGEVVFLAGIAASGTGAALLGDAKLSAPLLFALAPVAHAVDIPLLTWERGKEQNVVVGGATAEDSMQVKLLRPGSPQIMMKPSSRNKQGFLVYSATLPPDLPLGEYTVYVFGNGNASGSQVAQVEVIALTRYSITEIPMDLVFLFLTLIFIITALTVTRSGARAHLAYMRQRTLVENETLLFSKSEIWSTS
jgi:hypothetical protein